MFETRKIFKRIKKVCMTAEEKSSVKEALINFIRHNLAPTEKPAVICDRIRTAAWTNLFSPTWRVVTVLMLILVLAGSGAVYASEQSLPGDLLYPVKIIVNENIKTVLAFSTEAKAKVNLRVAEKRLEEAEKLIALGQLTEEKQTKIIERFQKKVSVAREKVDKLSADKDYETAADLGRDIDSSLRAHEIIIAALEENKKVETASGPAVAEVNSIVTVAAGERIKNTVAVRAIQTAGGRAETRIYQKIETAKTADGEKGPETGFDTSASFEKAAANKKNSAELKIAEVENYIRKKSAKASERILNSASAKLEVAKNLIEEGVEKQKTEDFVVAFEIFQKAHSIAQQAKMIFDASIKFRLDIE